MNYVKLTHEPLEIEALNELAANESCGAISIFVGTTRNNFNGKKVISLSYEAYEPMALKELQSICDKIRNQWTDIVHIVIYHRLGLVPVKEASVVICISSPHRQTSLEALSFAIDDLKKHVPIWKKEIYEDNSEWKENKESSTVRAKRLKVNLAENVACTIPESNLVQIKVSQDELDHRIESFLKTKRDDINQNNITDFTHRNSTESNTCARVNTFLEKQSQSKCHLKVRRVKNECGPQIENDYIQTLDKLMCNADTLNNSSCVKKEKDAPSSVHNNNKLSSIQERLELIEDELRMPITHKNNVFARLKLIEKRILQLEAISPEYKHFLSNGSSKLSKSALAYNDTQFPANLHKKPKIYALNEIDAIIEKYGK